MTLSDFFSGSRQIKANTVKWSSCCMRGSALNSDLPLMSTLTVFRFKKILICWFSHSFQRLSRKLENWSDKCLVGTDNTLWHASTTTTRRWWRSTFRVTHWKTYFLHNKKKEAKSKKDRLQKVIWGNFLSDGPGLVKNSSPIGFFQAHSQLPPRHYISHYPLNLISTARVPALDLRMATGLR